MQNKELLTNGFDSIVRFLREEWRIETYWTKNRIWFDVEQHTTMRQCLTAIHNADQLKHCTLPDAMKDVMRSLFRLNWIYVDLISKIPGASIDPAQPCSCDDGDCETCHPTANKGEGVDPSTGYSF